MKKNPNIKPLGFFAKIANYLMGEKGTDNGRYWQANSV